MLLTKFATKPATSAYDTLQNEVGYFSAPAARKNASVTSAIQTKNLTYNNMPQSGDALVARLHADIARVDAMTDAFGQEITRESIAKLSAFLAINNVTF